MIHFHKCWRQPKQVCVLGGGKSSNATKNWCSSRSGYCGCSWKWLIDLYDIVGICWGIVVWQLLPSCSLFVLLVILCSSTFLLALFRVFVSFIIPFIWKPRSHKYFELNCFKIENLLENTHVYLLTAFVIRVKYAINSITFPWFPATPENRSQLTLVTEVQWVAIVGLPLNNCFAT